MMLTLPFCTISHLQRTACRLGSGNLGEQTRQHGWLLLLAVIQIVIVDADERNDADIAILQCVSPVGNSLPLEVGHLGRADRPPSSSRKAPAMSIARTTLRLFMLVVAKLVA